MSQPPESRPFDILLVEDNPGDVRLVMESLSQESVPSTLHVARDGVEALRFLRRQGPYTDRPRPDVVLLDLNLPRKDGREVLEEVKADPDLCRIPVVVFTTSTADGDVLRSYDLHANCFVTKPIDLDEFMMSVRAIAEFWLNTARLPAR
jgi:CheY-like chemotaxis protein